MELLAHCLLDHWVHTYFFICCDNAVMCLLWSFLPSCFNGTQQENQQGQLSTGNTSFHLFSSPSPLSTWDDDLNGVYLIGLFEEQMKSYTPCTWSLVHCNVTVITVGHNVTVLKFASSLSACDLLHDFSLVFPFTFIYCWRLHPRNARVIISETAYKSLSQNELTLATVIY